jgi:hypothetical protein
MSTEQQETKATAPTKDVEASGIANENENTEGTFHQSQLGPKAKRKHFFSPLDQAYSDAVHKDAETVVFTEKEEVNQSSGFTLTSNRLTCVYFSSTRLRGRLTTPCFLSLFSGMFVLQCV